MKRVLVLLAVLLLTACGPLGQPSADEIVRRAEAAMDTLEEAHAIVEMNVTLEERDVRVVGEGWVQGEQVRATVLEATEPELVGTVAVRNGDIGWLYNPAHNTVLTGNIAELKRYKEEHTEVPAEADLQGLTEAVDELLQITNQELVGEATVAGLEAWHLRLTPNEEAPPELVAAGGTLELWISQAYDIPLQVRYSGSSLGEGLITVREYDNAPDFESALFEFTPPTGAEVIDVSTLLPEHMTLAEAQQAAGFPLLSTAADNAEAALMEVYRLKDGYIQEFDGTLGQWTLAQGASLPDGHLGDMQRGEPVTVRGTEGRLVSDATEGWTILAWEEAGAYRLLRGNVAPEVALRLAEALE